MNGRARPERLVLGVGNPHRRDDGIGPLLAPRIAARLAGGWRHAAERGDDVACLIAAWEGCADVVVVDAAMMAGAPAGTACLLEGRRAATAAPPGAPSSHGVGLGQAIGLARALGALPPRLRVVLVAGADFGQGDGLSGALTARLEPLAQEIAAALCACAVSARYASPVPHVTTGTANAMSPQRANCPSDAGGGRAQDEPKTHPLPGQAAAAGLRPHRRA